LKSDLNPDVKEESVYHVTTNVPPVPKLSIFVTPVSKEDTTHHLVDAQPEPMPTKRNNVLNVQTDAPNVS